MEWLLILTVYSSTGSDIETRILKTYKDCNNAKDLHMDAFGNATIKASCTLLHN